MNPESLLSTAKTATDLTVGPGFDLWNLIQFGLLGVGFACLAKGKWIVPEWVLRRAEERHAAEVTALRAERDGYKGQVEKLQGTVESMIPALTRSTEVAAKYNEELARQRWKLDSEAAGERT